MRASEKPHDRQIWNWIALSASVTLNVFLIAIIAGHVLHRDVYPVKSGRALLERGLANAEAALSAPDAAAFRTIINRDAAVDSEAAAEIGPVRLELEKQIVAEPFDPAATKRAFTKWREAWNRFLDVFTNTLMDAFAKISPEGRRKLLEERPLGKLAPSIQSDDVGSH